MPALRKCSRRSPTTWRPSHVEHALASSTPRPAARYAWLSIGTALVVLALKALAYRVTGSVGLLSDALESLVNVAAAIVTLWALTLANRPADHGHDFGHSKAEYFASALEGLLILVAAAGIIVSSWPRLWAPKPLTDVLAGSLISLAATLLNGMVAWVLLRAGKRLSSIALRADAHHLFSDVWTSAGVLVGVILVRLTGWLVLDPLLAIVVSLHIAYIAARILWESGQGLLDTVISSDERALLTDILAPHQGRGIHFHAIKTRQAGQKRFIELHVLVPGEWTVQTGHDLCHAIESQVVAAIPHAEVITHLEPQEDPMSYRGHAQDASDPRHTG